MTLRRARRLHTAILPELYVLAWLTTVLLLGASTLAGLLALGLGAGALPWAVRRMLRAFRRLEVRLERSGPQLSLDGEPLEAARVETRVHLSWLRTMPAGYTVSLWALLVEGQSRDVELGMFRTLLEASEAAGAIDAFLARAATKSRPSRVS